MTAAYVLVALSVITGQVDPTSNHAGQKAATLATPSPMGIQGGLPNDGRMPIVVQVVHHPTPIAGSSAQTNWNANELPRGYPMPTAPQIMRGGPAIYRLPGPLIGKSDIPIGATSTAYSPPGLPQYGAAHNNSCLVCDQGCCLERLWNAYCQEFNPKKNCNSDTNTNCNECQGNGLTDQAQPYRRALPAPFQSPPFPMAEYQGFPLIGVPVSESVYPLMKAIYGGPWGEEIKDSRVKLYGWINASGNYSTCNQSNTPSAYWLNPNRMALEQAVLRLEREVDTVQTQSFDWGFRFTGDYGTNYRYFTAGGWGSDQLLVHNQLYGWDPTEVHANLYFPGVAQGMIVTIGRWIATPDIETQFAPDNYMATHSLLFSIDVYTETGIMATIMLDKQWTVQAALHAGADMAPWYAGAVPTGMFGVRWVSQDNCDSFYTVLNAINDAEFQYFDLRGVPAGHHNYNIFQSTWQHKFNDICHTKTEAYIMWERNAPVGGTPSIGPFQFNTGGGLGPTVPGTSLTYAVLNYTMFKLSDNNFLTFRNEWTKDEHGTRYGFPGNYSSNSIGLSHNFNAVLQIRPEIGYYRSWNSTAFDNGNRSDMWLYGFDVTLRF